MTEIQNKELVEQITNSMTETIEKALPEMVEATVSKKVEELSKKTGEDLEEVKEELKKINLNSKASDPAVKDLTNKTTIVALFKEVINNNITTEKGFQEAVAKTYAGMAEGSNGSGAEMVFDQFEADVLRVINTYQIVNDVKILPLAKGDNVSLPKATNGITTYWKDEAKKYTGSKPATAFVKIDIEKATTMTDLTQELMDDAMTIPDLYNLIVEFIGESQAEFLENEILTGDDEIEGVFENASINKIFLGSGKTSADIDDEVLVDVITKAKRKFKRNKSNVKFYMSQYVYGKLKALITTDGYPLYPELRGANPTLLGYKVELSDVGFVQDSTEDKAKGICLLFGDLNYYTLVRRKGLSIERGYYGDNWASDIVSIKSNQRIGGKATFGEAFTIVVNGATS